MIDMNKSVMVYDRGAEENCEVQLITSRHAITRFLERAKSVDHADYRVENAINQALDIIVNKYPREPSDFMVQSKSTGLKIPMKTEIETDTKIRVIIPTMLTSTMHSKMAGIPTFTFESMQYSMYTLIEVN